jgi:hypothetical protein
LRKAWIFAAEIDSPKELSTNSQITYHSEKFSNMIDLVIKELVKSGNLGTFKTKLEKLGVSHFEYDLKPEFFSVNSFLSF